MERLFTIGSKWKSRSLTLNRGSRRKGGSLTRYKITSRCFMLTAVLLVSPLFAAAAPIVNSTLINYTTNQITVDGKNFSPSGGAPTVLFNAVNLGPLVSFTNQTIVANLPSGTQPGT